MIRVDVVDLVVDLVDVDLDVDLVDVDLVDILFVVLLMSLRGSFLLNIIIGLFVDVLFERFVE